MILESMVTVKYTDNLTDISLHELFFHIYFDGVYIWHNDLTWREDDDHNLTLESIIKVIYT